MSIRKKRIVDWTKRYAAIGEYVVRFEQIVDKIRWDLCATLQVQGLYNFKLSQIVFGQKQFTADPLITCYESIFNELLRKKVDKDEVLTKVTAFKNKFKKQISFRNDLLHSKHNIGYSSVEGEFPDNKLLVIKTTSNKEGLNLKEVVTTVEDIQKNTRILEQLLSEFKYISISNYLLMNNMGVGVYSNDKK